MAEQIQEVVVARFPADLDQGGYIRFPREITRVFDKVRTWQIIRNLGVPDRDDHKIRRIANDLWKPALQKPWHRREVFACRTCFPSGTRYDLIFGINPNPYPTTDIVEQRDEWPLITSEKKLHPNDLKKPHFRWSRALLWFLMDGLPTVMTSEMMAHLGIPMKAEPEEIDHWRKLEIEQGGWAVDEVPLELKGQLTYKGLHTTIVERETGPHGSSSINEVLQIKVLGADEHPHWAQQRGRRKPTGGWSRFEPPSWRVFTWIPVYAYRPGQYIELGTGPTLADALLDADRVVPSDQWETWLETHLEVGEVPFDPGIFQALGTPNPLLGDRDTLITMLTTLGAPWTP